MGQVLYGAQVIRLDEQDRIVEVVIEQQVFVSPLDSRSARALGDALLAWWELHGRRDPVQKPWMFKADGQWPGPEEGLNPYPIHVAEVMRAARQHCPPYRTTDLEIGTTSWVCAPHVDTDAGVDSFDRWCIQVMLPEVHHGPIALSMRFGCGC